jgi:putative DNA primase/helicase
MREDFWTFEPTHKIVVSGNHKPIITGTDDGIWRRIRFVPWLVTIPVEERDRDLKQKLAKELPGILAWAVRGCLEWQRVGLADPQTVTKATSDFRAASDALTEFFELIEFGPDVPAFRVSKARLRKTYEAWCEAEGHIPLGARRFTERVRQRAIDAGTAVDERVAIIPYEAPHPIRAWFGVRVKES